MKPSLPFALLAASALCACSSTPATTYHLLQPLELESGAGTVVSGRLVALSIERFPTYLERVQLVRESAPARLSLWESHAWAEPLDDAFGRVLAEDLSLLLGRPVVLAGPMTRPPRADLAVELEVSRFDVRASGEVQLVATWTATDDDDATVVPPRRSYVTVSLDGDGPDAVAATTSAAVAELARRLAAELASIDS